MSGSGKDHRAGSHRKRAKPVGRYAHVSPSPEAPSYREQPHHPATKENTAITGLGVSLLVIAVGAVLAFAVHVTTSGFNINTVAIILLVVGAIGALISLILWSSWGGFGSARSETTVIER